jgi:GNAT superfamily N-acetyltransferase
MRGWAPPTATARRFVHRHLERGHAPADRIEEPRARWQHGVVPATIREYRPEDEEAVVELSLRAWAPVFASIEEAIGHELFERLHGDWCQNQEQSVRDSVASEGMSVWVAEAESEVIGFVAARRDGDRLMGEVWMVAVDPAHHDRGVGTLLTQFATDWLREAGMRTAMVETGDDPGHAPARRVYERAGYSPFRVVRYFKAL